MAVDPTTGQEIVDIPESEKRIKQLSDKVRLTSEERDEKDRLLKEQTEKTVLVEKERDFLSGFSDVLATNPLAKDHKDEIKTKVLAGYTVEDATYAVLGKAGKLGTPREPEPAPNPAGGSATTTHPQGGAKSLSDMTLVEKRAALVEAESKGDITL